MCVCVYNINPVSYTHLDVYKRQITGSTQGQTVVKGQILYFS